MLIFDQAHPGQITGHALGDRAGRRAQDKLGPEGLTDSATGTPRQCHGATPLVTLRIVLRPSSSTSSTATAIAAALQARPTSRACFLSPVCCLIFAPRYSCI